MLYFLTLIMLLTLATIDGQKYNVTVIDINTNPIVSYIDGSSEFEAIFNPSFIVSSPLQNTPGLMMRTQNCSVSYNYSRCGCSTDQSPSNQWQAASKLTFMHCNNIATTGLCDANKTNTVSNHSIVFEPSSNIDILGTEDPRILYNKIDNYYYMFYTSFGYGNQANPKQRTIYLSLARSNDPFVNGSWFKYGPIWDFHSKSGALLIEFDQTMNDYGMNYLYWGDNHITLTVSDNVTDWSNNRNTSKVFIQVRENGFDNGLVESGPPPLQLSDGNYIFFYNSANKGWPNANNTAYHPGFVIIDRYNKSNIVQRSGLNEPLLSPTFAWDEGKYPYTCNAKNVVFLEAAVQLTQEEKLKYIQMTKAQNGVQIDPNVDLIRVYFGGADAVIGTAVVQISW
eukprot:43749_1